MFKFTIATAIGLSAVVSAAQADMIVVQSNPSYPPVHVTPIHVTPTHGISAYNTPSFARMVEMCARFGFDCGVPGADAVPHPHLSPEAQADADKRLGLYADEWEDYAVEIEEQFETLPAPAYPRAHDLFGWNAPRSLLGLAPRSVPRLMPHTFPRTVPFAQVNPYQFGHRFPTMPRIAMPRIEVPYGFANPRGAFPRGPLIPWPSL